MSSTHITTHYGLGVFQMHNTTCAEGLLYCVGLDILPPTFLVYTMYSQNEWSTTPNLLHSVVTTQYLTYSCNSLIYLFNRHCFIFKCNSWDFSKLTFLSSNWASAPFSTVSPFQQHISSSRVKEGGRGGLF